MITELLVPIQLIIIIILVTIALYSHTNAIKEQIKWKSLNIPTLIYDISIYTIGVGIIGFCIYYIIGI